MLLSLLRLVLLVPLGIIASLVALLLCLRHPFDPTNSRLAARAYGTFLLPLFGISVRVDGWENVPDGPFIVAANHQSNFDLLIMGQAVPYKTVSLGKRSLRWIPLFGQVYWLSGNVLINRARGDQALVTMKLIQEALLKGHKSIWIFVEGTRNPGETLLPFKKGAFATAINSGVPILPICSARYTPTLSWRRWKNGCIPIRILPPIPTDGMVAADTGRLLEHCRAAMQDAIGELRVEGL